jgi:hypothetical protein
MISAASIQYELQGRFNDLADEVGKHHLSVRWESGPRIVRIGAMVENYDWEHRMSVLRSLRAFERDHADEFAVEYDILPLEAVNDEAFAEA